MTNKIANVSDSLVAELGAAARLAIDAIRMHCLTRHGGETLHLNEGLATIAGRTTESLWRLMPSHEFDDLASVSCAVQEVVEWAAHEALYRFGGEDRCRGPVTWWPSGVAGVSDSDVAMVAIQRAALLLQELANPQDEPLVASDSELAA